MDFLHSLKPRRRKIVSTRRKMKVLSVLNSDCRKCLWIDKVLENDQYVLDHGKEVIAFLQKEQNHVECLKVLKKRLTHPIWEENICSLKDIIELLDEMLSAHTSLCSILIYGKNDLSVALKQLSSCLNTYASYSVLINLEKSNFQKINDVHNDICMDFDLLQTPIMHISECKDFFKVLYSAVPEEVYGNMIKGVELLLNNIQNDLSLRDNAIRTLQIQRVLYQREPKILSPGRIVLKEGILNKVNHKGNGMKERVFILFSDIFLCCKMLSKTFNWQEKDSLLFCSLFPLNMCSVSLVMGSSSQGTLFKVTCGTMSYLLISEIPSEAQNWVYELQTAIRNCQKPNEELKPKLNRSRNTFLKKKTSPFFKQPRESESSFNIKKITEIKNTNMILHPNRSYGRIVKILTCMKN